MAWSAVAIDPISSPTARILSCADLTLDTQVNQDFGQLQTKSANASN